MIDKAHRRVIFASSLGTVFEWYDFYLYGSLAAVISRQFFAGVNETTAFIFALLAFAAGFAVRPFGAVLFGRLGDLVGRKHTFLITIVIMGVSTALVGLLPGFASIGVAAPIALIALRLLGVAPAVLVYAWGLHVLGRLGAGIAFLFLVAGSLRLARFNVISAKTDHRYFVGLPIPAGALTLSSIINYAPQPVTVRRFALVMMVVTIAIAFAMVSTVRYRSQKFKNVQKPVPVQVMLVIVLMIALFLKWPAEFMLIFGIFYVSSGPVVKLWNVAFPRYAEAEATAAPTPSQQN